MYQLCRVVCSDGEFTCSVMQLEEHSIFVREMMQESCQCTLTVMLPDFMSETVQLAVNVMGGGEGGREVMDDWPETVREIHSVLQIPRGLAEPDTRQVGNILSSYFTHVLYCIVLSCIVLYSYVLTLISYRVSHNSGGTGVT